MKAAVWHSKKDIRIEDVPDPVPAEGEIKVKVHYCGICGSDVHEYLAGPIFLPVDKPHPLTGKKAPIILGHEFSGEVAEIGKGVEGVKVGDLVAPWPGYCCGKCFWCRRGEPVLCEMVAPIGLMADGAFAEYVIVPAYFSITKIPPGVSIDHAALTEPLAVGLHAVRKSGIRPGDTVVVVGAGTIGLCTLQAARAAGARKILVVEIAHVRKELAMQLGADMVLDPAEVDVQKEIVKATDGIGADLAFECVGNQAALKTTMDSIRRGGKAIICGVFEKPAEIDMLLTVAFEKQIIGSFGHNDEFPIVLSYLKDKRFKAEPMISKKIKLENIVTEGFQELIDNKDRNIKILVSP